MFTSLAYSPPQIIEVRDNFGNTFDVGPPFSHDGTFARILNSEQEIIVSEDTEINFCVTEVRHEEDKNLEYKFKHSGFTSWNWQDDNCYTFENYTEDDWEGNNWMFEISLRDDSEIMAVGDYPTGHDFQFQPRYSNLLLPSESERDIKTTLSDTVNIPREEYEDLKNRSNELDYLKTELDQKESTISELESDLDEKQSAIEEKESRIEELEQKVRNLETGFTDWVLSFF